jgi:hypothetical protein
MIQAPTFRPAFRVVHHMVCRHQVEVAVQPPRAELYFRDERWIDPINTQLRFEAVVYNADRGVIWQVLAPGGGPGAGTIDATGVYRAPNMGALVSGTTDVVVATARADPLRKAFAWVTLVGLGPLPAPAPRIEIWPKRVTLFYPDSPDYNYIDDSNKRQVFRAFPAHTLNPRVQWLVNGTPQFPPVGTDPWFTYSAPADGSSYPANGASYEEVTVVAQLAAYPGVQDDAKVVLRNYAWPGF